MMMMIGLGGGGGVENGKTALASNFQESSKAPSQIGAMHDLLKSKNFTSSVWSRLSTSAQDFQISKMPTCLEIMPSVN